MIKIYSYLRLPLCLLIGYVIGHVAELMIFADREFGDKTDAYIFLTLMFFTGFLTGWIVSGGFLVAIVGVYLYTLIETPGGLGTGIMLIFTAGPILLAGVIYTICKVCK